MRAVRPYTVACLSGQTPTLFFPSRSVFLEVPEKDLTVAAAAAQSEKDARKGLEVEALVRSAAERVAASSGLDLVDIEMKRGGKGPLLRIFLDKPGRKIGRASCRERV